MIAIVGRLSDVDLCVINLTSEYFLLRSKVQTFMLVIVLSVSSMQYIQFCITVCDHIAMNHSPLL